MRDVNDTVTLCQSHCEELWIACLLCHVRSVERRTIPSERHFDNFFLVFAALLLLSLTLTPSLFLFISVVVTVESTPITHHPSPFDTQHSWNSDGARGPDCIYAYIDGEEIFLGIYNARTDEGRSSGRSAGGIRNQVQSQGKPRHIGFRGGSGFQDQIHRVTITIPNKYFKDGEIDLKLRTIVTATTLRDESSGFDNFKLTAYRNCNGCVPEKEISYEDFENSVIAGWSNGVLSSDPGFTKFLGRFTGTDEAPSKVYNIPSGATQAIIEFDFYEIDR